MGFSDDLQFALRERRPMRPYEPSNGGPLKALVHSAAETESISMALPFGHSIDFSSIGGPTYVTAQTLIQQVAYALSDKLFTYSPETFDLDIAVKRWTLQLEKNANGYPTTVQAMETRQGAGTIALGYIFSNDFDLKRRHIPQSILASSATLQYMRTALDQLSLLYSVANPFVAHIAAADYIGGPSGAMVSDYSTAMRLAEDLGLALVASQSVHESQHIALLSTLLATYLPTVHIYDGVRVGRETTRVIDTLNQSGLDSIYKSTLAGFPESDQKHLDTEGKILNLVKAFNAQLGTDYAPFEYYGHPEATSVLVTFGSIESSLTKRIATSLSDSGNLVGVINVRIYRPFIEEQFIGVLPKSTKTVGVLGQVQSHLAIQEDGIHAPLYEDVLAALTFSGLRPRPECVEIKYSPHQTWDSSAIVAVFQKLTVQPLANAKEVETSQPIDPSAQQYVFWDADDSLSSLAPLALGKALSKDSTLNVSTNLTYDNLIQGGLIRTDVRKGHNVIDAPNPISRADVSYVGDIKLLSKLQVSASVNVGGRIIIHAPGVADGDLEKKLPEQFRASLVQRGIELYILDTADCHDPSQLPLILQAAFLHVAHVDPQVLGGNETATALQRDAAFESLDRMLRKFDVPESWKPAQQIAGLKKLPKDIHSTSFAPFSKIEVEPASQINDWQAIAKGLAFKEAYGTSNVLRPDVSAKTYTVTVKENRKLTPPTYDRKIFHIEFDLGNSGLTYDIGEALGIHAENDEEHVQDFMKLYDLDPTEIVQVPSREDPEVFESRTIQQALIHNIDIFGKPPKRFYESLAEFATDEGQKSHLLRLAGPEGAEELKKRSDDECLNFADILQEFSSAHPSFQNLIKIVNPMKRREYSIASCQKVTPNSVALMVVVVRWLGPKETMRYGQASNYLSKLKIGAKVTVSVKPSVMKLPPKSTQPIIMAGLGTGLAPFRAFVQHRALEKSQGKEIGSVLLYMGARHQEQEYCYGEEWEAYQAAGVITLLGRAFSRDQPSKIYIQDRMRETLPEITKAYLEEEGAFYLCGPTWPVPDVTAVLEDAIALDAKTNGKKVDTRKEIEKLKDEQRYVLEVY